MYWLLFALIAGVVLLVAAYAADDLPEPRRETFNCSADGSLWPYLVQPTSADPRAVLVNLHGHYSDHHQGMTVGTYNDHYGKLRRACLARNWAYVCPWYGGNSWMGPLAESGLCDLLSVLQARWPERPVYLSGGSMGGSSTLVFAVRRPDLLDGIVARCPAADIESYYAFAAASDNPTLQNIASAIRIHYTADGRDLSSELRARSALYHAERLEMPVYLCHGAKDELIPVGPTRALVARLTELGRRVRYLELPEGNHDAPATQVDNWQEVMDFVEGA